MSKIKLLCNRFDFDSTSVVLNTESQKSAALTIEILDEMEC